MSFALYAVLPLYAPRQVMIAPEAKPVDLAKADEKLSSLLGNKK